MESVNKEEVGSAHRRQRLHELLIALISRQEDIELMEAQSPEIGTTSSLSNRHDPARWLDRNKRILSKYQSLIRSAITLDALLDSEEI